MSSVNKISSVFSSVGVDNVPLIDVFNDKDLKIKNALVSKVNGLSDTALKTIVSDSSLLKKVSGILITKELGKFDLSVSGISGLVGTTDIGTKLKGLGSSFTDGFKDKISSTLKDINLNPVKNSLGNISLVNGVVNELKQVDIDFGSMTSSFLNKAVSGLGVGKILNLDLEHAVLSALIKDSLDSGGANVVTGVLQKYRNGYTGSELAPYIEDVIKVSVKDNLIDVMRTGDIAGINNLLAELRVGEAVERYPDIASDILRYYKLPNGSSVSDYEAQLTVLESALDHADPNWYNIRSETSNYVINIDALETEVISKERFNLKPFVKLSEDAKSVLRMEAENKYLIQITIAPSFTNKTNIYILKNQLVGLVLNEEVA